MLEWKPRRLLGVGTALGAILAITLLDGLLLAWVRTQPISLVSFVLGLLVILSGLAAVVLCYLVYGLLTLRYLIGRDSITISWAWRQETIPLAAIEDIGPLAERGNRIRARGFFFPGHRLGRGREDEGREVLFYSTGARTDELFIVTTARSYVIAPSNPTGFLSAVRARRRLGPTQSLEQVRREGGLAGLPVWRDRIALGLAATAAAANAALFGYVAFLYQRLPEIVPLVSEAGQVQLLGAKEQLWELPAIGLVVLLANTGLGFALHRWERPATYSLEAMAVVVQILVWSAAISVMA
jgi:hypothetical protein